jgi:ribonuclease HII
MLVGIDEAGRGPVIGPLVVCAAAVSEDSLPQLESLNLRDSKKYTPRKREELEEIILSLTNCTYTEISASRIDAERRRKTLNDIEVELFARLVSSFPGATQIIVDACDVNETRFGERICQCTGISSITSEHRADDTYPIVAAASIIAKVVRDRRIDQLKKVYGDFGSGYPSDEKTRTYLKEYIKREGKLPPIVRSSWDTARVLLQEYSQCSLDTFL